jgi:hypothetical protein
VPALLNVLLKEELQLEALVLAGVVLLTLHPVVYLTIQTVTHLGLVYGVMVELALMVLDMRGTNAHRKQTVILELTKHVAIMVAQLKLVLHPLPVVPQAVV